MAAYNPFVGKTQAWLEEQLSLCQDELASGKTTISVSAGDTSTSERVEISIHDRMRMILRALNLLAPSTYPLIDPVRRTRPQFL